MYMLQSDNNYSFTTTHNNCGMFCLKNIQRTKINNNNIIYNKKSILLHGLILFWNIFVYRTDSFCYDWKYNSYHSRLSFINVGGLHNRFNIQEMNQIYTTPKKKRQRLIPSTNSRIFSLNQQQEVSLESTTQIESTTTTTATTTTAMTTSTTEPLSSSILWKEWEGQYRTIMKDLMQQARVLNGFQSGTKSKKRNKGSVKLTDQEIQIVQEYLLESMYDIYEIIQKRSREQIFERGTTTTTSSFREQLVIDRNQFWHTNNNNKTERNAVGKEEGNTKIDCHDDITVNGVVTNLDGSDSTIPTTGVHNYNNRYQFTNPILQYEYAACCLSYIADICAKQQLPGPCIIAWYKLRHCGILPRENCVSTYMYVFSLILTSSSSLSLSSNDDNNIIINGSNNNNNAPTTNETIIDASQTSDNNQKNTNENDAIMSEACYEVATFHDLLYKPSEKTVTLRIKMLIAKGDPHEAEKILSSIPDKRNEGDTNNNKNNKKPKLNNDNNKVINEQQKQQKNHYNNNNEKSDWKRLRTFLPILSYYCNDTLSSAIDSQESDKMNNDNMQSVLRLFVQMRNSEGVYLDSETYGMILSALARNGWFGENMNEQASKLSVNEIVEKTQNDDILNKKGPTLLDNLLSIMADEILELNEVDVQTIHRGFMTWLSRSQHNNTDLISTTTNEVPKVNAYHTSRQDNKQKTQQQQHMLIGRVEVDQNTSICPETGARLRLFALSESQRTQVHDTLLQMAAQLHEEFGEKFLARRNQGVRKQKYLAKATNNRDDNSSTPTTEDTANVNNGQYAYAKLLEFSEWLRDRRIEPSSDEASNQQQYLYTAIVDGPNVAYFGHGDVHYSQVLKVVETLEQMGERPLVVMPQKYIADKFWISLGCTQELTAREKKIRDQLLERKQMYVVPTACLDDYYWMLASVAYTPDECKLMVDEATSSEGRFPGLRPLIITNDQMRDHRLSLLLEPRSFRRWTSCHIVNYFLEPYQNNEWEERTITFKPADSFSREIQGNPINNPRLLQEKNIPKLADCSATAWHIPVSEWEEPVRFCISLVTTPLSEI